MTAPSSVLYPLSTYWDLETINKTNGFDMNFCVIEQYRNIKLFLHRRKYMTENCQQGVTFSFPEPNL